MVSGVADKLGHVVQVELSSLCQAVGWVARVATGDGYNQKSRCYLFGFQDGEGARSGWKEHSRKRATKENNIFHVTCCKHRGGQTPGTTLISPEELELYRYDYFGKILKSSAPCIHKTSLGTFGNAC